MSQEPEKPHLETIVNENTSKVAGRLKLIVSITILLGALGYFVFMTVDSATVYYYTIAEIEEKGADDSGKLVRVSGKLVSDSFTRPPNSVLARFDLTDGTKTLNAVHSGIVPDLFFNEHSNIVLEGLYTQSGVFESQNVIVKCPSKYIASE